MTFVIAYSELKHRVVAYIFLQWTTRILLTSTLLFWRQAFFLLKNKGLLFRILKLWTTRIWTAFISPACESIYSGWYLHISTCSSTGPAWFELIQTVKRRGVSRQISISKINNTDWLLSSTLLFWRCTSSILLIEDCNIKKVRTRHIRPTDAGLDLLIVSNPRA